MLDETTHQERLQRRPSSEGTQRDFAVERGGQPRKQRPRAERLAICAESGISRRRWSSVSGTATACGSLIAGWEPGSINPSEGLLLKFSGDLVYLVLIRGSNLDRPLNEGVHQSHPRRLPKASGALGPRDDRRGNQAGGRDGTDHRQHRGGGVRVARRPQGMAQQESPGVYGSVIILAPLVRAFVPQAVALLSAMPISPQVVAKLTILPG